METKSTTIPVRNKEQWIEALDEGSLDSLLTQLYPGDDELEYQKGRYLRLLDVHGSQYPGSGQIRLFSTPGRTELAGNHTDHNNGRVVAGSIHLDAIAAVSCFPGAVGCSGTDCQGDQVIRLYSVDMEQSFIISLDKLDPNPEEFGTTQGLIRGVAAWFNNRSISVGRLCMTVQSNVFPGSGLSSSACIEVLLATIIDEIFNNGATTPIERAQCGQFAENNFFGKPSGLMDQMACSVGGVIGIDFHDSALPKVQEVFVDFNQAGYQLAIIDTRSSHAGDTSEYAAIPNEMKLVANLLGAGVLGEADPSLFWDRFAQLRETLPGRAVARAAHFFQENERVVHMITCLTQNPPDILGWLREVQASGNSSQKYLQNVIDQVENQDYALALAATEALSSKLERRGEPPIYSRVHGGGFGGTIQVYVPIKHWDSFVDSIENIIGPGTVTSLHIRSKGSIEIH